MAGLVWMLLSGLCFVAVNAVVKHLGNDIPPAQSAFLRYLFGTLLLLPVLPSLIRAEIGGRVWGTFAVRGAVHSLAVLAWFYAMTQITIAEVTAMGYLNPVFVTLGAALFLGETLRLRRLIAVAVAILGALIVLRPGVREVSPGHLAMIGAALFFAASYLMAKRLTAHVGPWSMVAMLSIGVTVALSPWAVAVWQPIGLREVAWLLLIAVCATMAHYAMTRAFAAAPLGVTQPATALQLVWAVALGALVFGEPVDAMVVLGGVLVAGAVVFIALREEQLRRAQARAASQSAR